VRGDRIEVMKVLQNVSARQRMLDAGPSVVAVLEPEKAARFKAKTMLIPSPLQVQKAISEIPYGEAKTLLELRKTLADASEADVTCPYSARVCWELVAEAAEEDRADGKSDVTPWWRVTKDHKPSPKLPGGAERHRALLLVEGVRI